MRNCGAVGRRLQRHPPSPNQSFRSSKPSCPFFTRELMRTPDRLWWRPRALQAIHNNGCRCWHSLAHQIKRALRRGAPGTLDGAVAAECHGRLQPHLSWQHSPRGSRPCVHGGKHPCCAEVGVAAAFHTHPSSRRAEALRTVTCSAHNGTCRSGHGITRCFVEGLFWCRAPLKSPRVPGTPCRVHSRHRNKAAHAKTIQYPNIQPYSDTSHSFPTSCVHCVAWQAQASCCGI